jgi:hypothetical protein
MKGNRKLIKLEMCLSVSLDISKENSLFSFVNVIVAESSATDVLNCKSFHLWIALQV